MPADETSNQDLAGQATRRARELEDENDPYGRGGAFGPLNTKGPLDSPLGLIGMAGIIVSLAFVALWVIERRRSGGSRIAGKRIIVQEADQRQSKLGLALRFVAHLSMRTWLGLLGILELIIAFVLVLALNLVKPASPYLPNTTAQALVTWMGVIGMVEILLILVMTIIWIYERYGLRGLSQSAQLYARLLRFSDWLHVRWRDSQTPHERGAAFAVAAPAASEFIEQIVDIYAREQYGPTPPDAANAEQLWQATSPLLWLAGVRQRWRVIRRRWDDFIIWRDALSRRLNSQFGEG
jgi:hypothetical protein